MKSSMCKLSNLIKRGKAEAAAVPEPPAAPAAGAPAAEVSAANRSDVL